MKKTLFYSLMVLSSYAISESKSMENFNKMCQSAKTSQEKKRYCHLAEAQKKAEELMNNYNKITNPKS